MWRSKEQLLLPGLLTFTCSEGKITNQRILLQRVPGMRGALKIPPVYFIVEKKVNRAKEVVVQTNPNIGEEKEVKVKPALPSKPKISKPQSKRKHPYISRLKISSM